VDVARGCVGVDDCEWVSGNQLHGHACHRYINTKVGLQSRCTGCFYSMTRFQQALKGAFLEILPCGLLQIVGIEKGIFFHI